jgi:hypothetical protein
MTAAQQLATLKQQLRRQLADVEARERELEDQQRPKTLAEVEQLEQRLMEALEKVRAERGEMDWPQNARPAASTAERAEEADGGERDANLE